MYTENKEEDVEKQLMVWVLKTLPPKAACWDHPSRDADIMNGVPLCMISFAGSRCNHGCSPADGPVKAVMLFGIYVGMTLAGFCSLKDPPETVRVQSAHGQTLSLAGEFCLS